LVDGWVAACDRLPQPERDGSAPYGVGCETASAEEFLTLCRFGVFPVPTTSQESTLASTPAGERGERGSPANDPLSDLPRSRRLNADEPRLHLPGRRTRAPHRTGFDFDCGVSQADAEGSWRNCSFRRSKSTGLVMNS